MLGEICKYNKPKVYCLLPSPVLPLQLFPRLLFGNSWPQLFTGSPQGGHV